MTWSLQPMENYPHADRDMLPVVILGWLILAMLAAGCGPRTHLKRLFEVTAYCPCERCCGKADGIAATGVDTRIHLRGLAADWSVCPPGTRIAVPGYGEARVDDRGGAIQGDRLDVRFPTHAAALDWGRRSLVCTVLE
jgi:3D (Asp-Asp-Asp) domain-containing protein